MAAFVLIALMTAGCSSAPAKTDTANSSTTTNHDQAVKFSECMRSHGVSAFPDPDPSGELTLDGVANGSSLNPNAASFQQALSACKDLEPSGFTGNKRTPQQQENALKWAQCIRDNGVKDFPDPAPDGPILSVNASKPGFKAAFAAASKKCSGLLAAAGVTKPGDK